MVDNKYVPNLSGFYLGKVLRHEKYGRCKIWIPAIHKDDQKEKPDELPDAVQVSTLFGGGFKGNGMFSYPNLESIVVCFFINRDQNFPAYLGMLLDGPEAFAEWDKVIPELPAKKPSKIHRINSGQSYIEIAEDGQIIIETWSKTNANQKSKITICKEGDIKLESKSQISLNAPTIVLDAGQQVKIRSPFFTNVSSQKNTTVCDSINLDASGGIINMNTILNPAGSPIV